MENTSVCFKNKKDECLSHREVNAFLSLWETLSLAMVSAAQGSDTGVRVGVVMTLRRQE